MTNTPEEKLQALRDGKTLVVDNDKSITVKIVNGIICKYEDNKLIVINYSLCPEYFEIQEPKPEFAITHNQLAEYETRDGGKVVCYGILTQSNEFWVFHRNFSHYTVSPNGKVFIGREDGGDIIRKIRDL